MFTLVILSAQVINQYIIWCSRSTFHNMISFCVTYFASWQLPPLEEPSLKMSSLETSTHLESFVCLFVCLFMAALGLYCCTQAIIHCGARASHCGDFSCCRAQALGTRASVVSAHGLSSCGSWALERRLRSCSARA